MMFGFMIILMMLIVILLMVFVLRLKVLLVMLIWDMVVLMMLIRSMVIMSNCSMWDMCLKWLIMAIHLLFTPMRQIIVIIISMSVMFRHS